MTLRPASLICLLPSYPDLHVPLDVWMRYGLGAAYRFKHKAANDRTGKATAVSEAEQLKEEAMKCTRREITGRF